MQAIAINKLSREDYYALEETSTEKHEFYNGEMFAMSGGAFNHSAISVNTVSALKIKLRGKCCQPINSDMRIETPSGLCTYPDASIYCGKPQLTANQCSLLNPVVIIEVLSPSTRLYDQSDKFTLYRSIASFCDYLLIDSEKVAVQHFRKIENNEWVLHDYCELSESIYLNSINESLTLAEFYEGIDF
ncbi:MAG: Uma2 family endonuclease [Methylococcaceae bacterium]